jgi:hypothetical protein
MSIYIQTVGFNRGYAWIAEAFPYFTRNPLGWIAAIVVLFIISMVVGIIPLGGILINIFYPVIIGGYMLGCIAHKSGQSFEFQHIFAGFKQPYFNRLVLLGVFYTIATFIVIILAGILAFFMLGGLDFFQQIETAQIEDISALLPNLILVALVSITLLTPCIMALWFAPVIIVDSEETTLTAMLMSFNACLKNILPFTLYGLILLILAVIAAIPFMLGYLILIPVLSASVYVSYLDCFKHDTSNDPIQLLPG